MNIFDYKKTPLIRINQQVGKCSVWVKDESKNPTGTFKDRLAWALTRQLWGQSNLNEVLISCITMGNTVKSIGYFFSKLFAENNCPQILGLFPQGFSKRIIGPDSSGKTITGLDLINYCEGVRCEEIDLETRYLTPEDIKKIAIDFGMKFNVYRDVSYGIGEMCYSVILKEALEQMPELPSHIYVPVGAGVLFDECVEVVESSKIDAIVVGITVVNENSLADKIYGYYSPYFQSLLKNKIAYHPKYDRHPVIIVSDDEIKGALQFTSAIGIDTEPSAAASFVPIVKQERDREYFPVCDNVLVINTGNGMNNIQ